MVRLVPDIVGADPMAAALLIECRGRDKDALADSISEVNKALVRHGLPFGAKAAVPQPLEAYPFSPDAKVMGMRGAVLFRLREVTPQPCCLLSEMYTLFVYQ
jgi:hypothetical protein